jgi:pyrroline-5-carboxylate reductase
MTDQMTDDQHLEFPGNVLFFGCGNMGGAMLRGWIAAGVDPARFIVIDPVASDLPADVRHFKNTAELDTPADVVILAIKPQLLPALRNDIAACLSDNAMLVSIMAGTSIETLSANFQSARVARLMPNLAAAIGKSPLALTSNILDTDERAALSNWIEPLGTPIWIADESQMDAVTALAGSGPAFVYRFIDALAAGGAALGLDREVSNQLALSMVEGAAILAAESSESLQKLAARVTSPGGTTASGIAVLDDHDQLAKLVETTLRAARDRGIQLGKTVT